MDDLLGIGGGTKSDEDGPDDSDIAIVAYVDRKLDECRQSANRIAHESIWLTNTAQMLGYDMAWDSTMRSFRSTSDMPRKGNPIKANLVLPTIQNRTARLCKSPPRYEVRPNSMDVEDKDACRLGKMLIEHIWDAQRLNRKRIDLYMWKQQCGHSYLKISWDQDLGNKVQDPMTGQTVKMGDIRIDVTPSFEIYPDPAAKSLDECAYIIQTKVRPLSYFRSNYENGALVKEESITLLGLQYQQKINSLNARSSGDGSAPGLKNMAVEKAFYQAPTDNYPDGRMIITANGIKLDDKPLPCGELPFCKFDDIIVGGKYYSEAAVTHMLPLQRYHDRLLNQGADWTRKLIAGKYSVARGAGIAAEAMDDQSGELVEYDVVPNAPDGGRPSPIPVPMIPSYFYTEQDRARERMYEIAGISDVARGDIPSASIPAAGMQILLEADETRIGIMTEADEHSWARMGMLILKYAQKYYIEPRLLKQSGGNGYLVKSFTGSDLKDNFDVSVIRGSTIPNSTVMKRQDILNVYGQGLLGDPTDPSVREKVLGMLEFGDIAEAWKDQSLDEMQVKKAIEQIEMGIAPPMSEFDNHPFWLKELNRYRKSDKFDKLAPVPKAIFTQTMEMCITNMMPPGMKAPPAPMPAEQPEGQPPMANPELEQEMAPQGGEM